MSQTPSMDVSTSSTTESNASAESFYSSSTDSFILENEQSASTWHRNLQSAIHLGDVDVAKTLLCRELSVNEPDLLGRTLLHFASFNGNDKMVELLLEYNAKVDARDYLGQTSVHAAAAGAGSLETFKLLLHSSGESINVKTAYKSQTPLHFAALEGHLHLIRYIIQNGGEVECPDTRCFTPIHMAVIGGHPKSVKELVKHAPDFTINPEYRRLIYIAAVGSENIYLNTLNQFRLPKLSDEQQLKYAEILDILLEAGCQFYENVGHATPLYCALNSNHHLIIQKLLYWGSNVNILVHGGVSPLHKAVTMSDQKIIKMLLKNGGNLTIKTTKGFLPLHYVSMCKKYKNLSILMDAGADINAQTSFGITIIEGIGCITPNHDFFIYVILRYNFNINAIIYDGNTPLYELCRSYNCKVSCILLDWFLDFNIQNDEGETPLGYIIKRCSEEHVKFIIKAMVIESHKNFEISSLNMDLITSSSHLDFYEDCKKEFKNLKQKKVLNQARFSEFIDKPLEKLREYTRNAELIEVLNSEVLNSFPIYGDLIKRRIEFAIRLRKLHEKSHNFLRNIFNPCDLPVVVGYKILNFLNVDEMEKLTLI